MLSQPWDEHDDPDSKDHGANMGPTWVLSAPGVPHVGPMDLAIRGITGFKSMGYNSYPLTKPILLWHGHGNYITQNAGDVIANACLKSGWVIPCLWLLFLLGSHINQANQIAPLIPLVQGKYQWHTSNFLCIIGKYYASIFMEGKDGCWWLVGLCIVSCLWMSNYHSFKVFQRKIYPLVHCSWPGHLWALKSLDMPLEKVHFLVTHPSIYLQGNYGGTPKKTLKFHALIFHYILSNSKFKKCLLPYISMFSTKVQKIYIE